MTSAIAYCLLVRIEGLSLSMNGQQAVFCSQLPTYATADYVAWLAEPWPALVSERGDPLGGKIDRGGTTVAILDFGNLFSRLLGVNEPALSTLASAISATATTIVLNGAPTFPAGSRLVYIGGEAIQWTSTSAGGTQLDSCARGVLGTIQLPHAADATVYAYSPLLRGRTVRLSIVRQDALSSNDEVLLGEYVIEDPIELDAQDLSTWRIGGSGRTRFLDRSIGAGRRLSLSVTGTNWLGISVSADASVSTQAIFSELYSDNLVTLRIGDEVIRFELVGGVRPYLRFYERGAAGTTIKEIARGDQALECLDADPYLGAFRYAPGPDPDTDPATGSFVAIDHFCDMLLCLLTSSAHVSDGLRGVNHKGSTGLYSDAGLSAEERSNWSGLPIGWGLGIPANLIDIGSFLRVKERCWDLRFPWTVIDRAQPFLAWAEEAFLRAVGAFLTINASGQIALVMPRLPSYADTPASLDEDSIIEIESISPSSGGAFPAITYELAEGREFTFRASDIDPDLLGVYYADLETRRIPAKYGRPDPSSLHGPLMRQAQRAILLFGRPFVRVGLIADYETARTWVVGSVVLVTHPELPTLDSDARGWTDVPCLVVERQIAMPGEHPHVRLMLWGLGSQRRAPTLSAAGWVNSSALNGSNRDVTLAANLFTDTANRQGLPTSDATAFRVGDLVQEWTASLSSQVGSPRTVIARSGNVLTISGTGAPTGGNWLVGADWDDLTLGTEQATEDAVMADRALLKPGSGATADAFFFAER